MKNRWQVKLFFFSFFFYNNYQRPVVYTHGGVGVQTDLDFFFYNYNSCVKMVKTYNVFIINNNPPPHTLKYVLLICKTNTYF